MRPLRLMLEGFGSYRDRTELDLSDVDFFVLTGPTGSGKSTIIDALCFALYGTVPRWGRGNSIRNALAPSTTECRVCLVFEVSGRRYAVVRQLRRNANGTVSTKEARLDRLDPAVPANADQTKILEASVEQIAEGPDPVSGGVTRLLGIGYEHFTQCVLLPQGRFAEFLQATPAARQDLLIELLAYTVYEDVGQLARERAKVAATELALAEQRLAEVGTVTDDDFAVAQRRVTDLAELVEPVETALRTAGVDVVGAVTTLLAAHGIDVSAAPAQAAVALARHSERAARDLADLRARRDTVVRRTAEVARCREQREVADLLGGLLKSNGFEQWLCSEALNCLTVEASETLLQLSGGQFELRRDDKSDLVVVDHADAGALRPVNTLSAGETFQASLALALALSSQVAGLSGSRRDLNAMFLDEGFGTLDDTTLDIVARTLERLAAAQNRMVGIVTHVSALADRVPVRFAVCRQGGSSRIQRLGA